jgi:hypothetical protein
MCYNLYAPDKQPSVHIYRKLGGSGDGMETAERRNISFPFQRSKSNSMVI